MKRSTSAGFTLVELLVVIAIIGLLATFAVSQLSSSRDKARIAKGQAQSGQILRSVGDDLIARWDFDECGGTTFGDLSGYAHPGILVSGVNFSSVIPGSTGCSLSFDGTNQITISNIPVGALQTKTMWVYATSSVATSQIILSEGGTNNWIEIIGGRIRTGTNASGNYFDSNKTLTAKTWYFVATTYDGTALKLYIDGSIDKSQNVAAQTPGAITLGAYDSGAARLSGAMDDVRIFNRALTSEEIRHMYAEGLPRHLAGKK